MFEDTKITEFRVKPIDANRVVEAGSGETAYAQETVGHGECATREAERKKLSSLESTPKTLAFEFNTECDWWPYELATYNPDKTLNAKYNYGEHSPEGDRYQEECGFKPGEKVLCLMFEGYNAVFPAIVVGPLSEEYLRELYERDEDMQLESSSAEEAISSWKDFHWDSVIVRPLVRLTSPWGEMKDTEIVNRVYVFPYKYKKFEV